MNTNFCHYHRIYINAVVAVGYRLSVLTEWKTVTPSSSFGDKGEAEYPFRFRGVQFFIHHS